MQRIPLRITPSSPRNLGVAPYGRAAWWQGQGMFRPRFKCLPNSGGFAATLVCVATARWRGHISYRRGSVGISDTRYGPQPGRAMGEVRWCLQPKRDRSLTDHVYAGWVLWLIPVSGSRQAEDVCGADVEASPSALSAIAIRIIRVVMRYGNRRVRGMDRAMAMES